MRTKANVLKLKVVVKVRILGVYLCVSGGDPGIRTLGGMTLAGFQDRYIRPTLSDLHVSVNSKKSGGATRI